MIIESSNRLIQVNLDLILKYLLDVAGLLRYFGRFLLHAVVLTMSNIIDVKQNKKLFPLCRSLAFKRFYYMISHLGMK